MNNKKGFTLIELLVVVLIIGILAAMAMPQYFKAVERSRMSEAVTLLANIAQAQQRKYLQINKYTANFQGLDVTPKGAQGSTYQTKGNPSAAKGAATGNGFIITLDGTNLLDFGAAYAKAERQPIAGSTLQYDYTLYRFYAGVGTACEGSGSDSALANGKALCADFCGIDNFTDSNKACCSDGTEAADFAALSALAGSSCKAPGSTDVGTAAAAAPANP